MRVLQFAKRPVVTVALLSVALAGCSGESFSDAPFNPAGTAADLEAMNATFESEAFTSFSTFSWMFDAALGGSPIISNSVAAIGIRGKTKEQVQAAAARVAQRMSAMLSQTKTGGMSASQAMMAIPAGVAGRTFEYDGTGYVISDRPLLATNKVRFILYEVDPGTLEPADPLVETGYVDLTDLSSGSTQAARVQVVSGGTTYIDYTASASGGTSSARISVIGYVTDGSIQASINLRSTFSWTTGLTLTYSLDLPQRDVSIDLSMGQTNVSETGSPITLNLTMRGPNGTVSMSGQFTETSGSFTIRINGSSFATITITDASITIARTDGTPLTEEEFQTFDRVYALQNDAFFAFDQMMAPVGAFFTEPE
jgi:hypothetical protein